MDETILEAEAVDERLERRAGRAQCLSSCRPARRGACRNNPPTPHVRALRRWHYRPPEWRPKRRARATARSRAKALERALHRRIDGQPMNAALLRLERDDLIGGMRRERRHRLACALVPAPALAGAISSRGTTRLRDGAVEHAVARRARPVRRCAVGPPRFRRLRQGDQQSRLRRATAVAAPCRSRPARPRGCLRDCRHRAPASDRAREFRALLSACSSSKSAGHLPQLGAKAAVFARLEQTRHLHR